MFDVQNQPRIAQAALGEESARRDLPSSQFAAPPGGFLADQHRLDFTGDVAFQIRFALPGLVFEPHLQHRQAGGGVAQSGFALDRGGQLQTIEQNLP
ncbi:hypothetical protein AVW16_00345 [Crenobacter luteus]|uniref:Uncharacterized protein n=1 Tax=Crenobacter luteus TaxID=1452487 RepID=A0A165F6A4_9NEIS|nr:hypothetical protein AVW16_00345 [Crenobacter luteus]